jgi:hypothetical protein
MSELVVPLLDRIESSTGHERDAAIVETVELLRSIDMGVFHPPH